MDPTKCWYDLLSAVGEARTEDARELAEALNGWLARGGFAVWGWDRVLVVNFCTYVQSRKF